MLMTPTKERNALVTLQLWPAIEMTDDQFFEFCQINRDWCIERTKEGELEIMSPSGGETGSTNLGIEAALYNWSKRDGTGVGFNSSTGFDLPNGATRAPDASWVRRERLADLTREQKKKFLPLCPDFVVELRSPSDSLRALQEKMEEYVNNGAQLGWLIDPEERQVFIYRPGQPVEHLKNPTSLVGDPLLSGFVLDLKEIWEPDL